MRVNLLKETTAVLASEKRHLTNIRGISNREGYITVADYVTMATDFWYDNESPSPVIDPYLKIIGKSWWLERVVKNGKEQWIFMQKPSIPALPAHDFTLKNVEIPINQGENQ